MTSTLSTRAAITSHDVAEEQPRREHASDTGSRSTRVIARALRLIDQLGRPALWLTVVVLILAPCACFLILAISPRLFDQGSQWFTLSYLGDMFSGSTATALLNSIWVSCAAAGFGLAVGFPIAWLAHRTNLPARRLFVGSMWFVILLPSWLPALGWQRLVQVDGVMYRLGLNFPVVTHLVMGPVGVVLLLGLRCVPFTYLALSAGLSGLGQEFEDAARVHGASRVGSIRLVAPILAPAIMSALAIGFAETVSDFGVASTLAYTSHFQLATYQLYADINNFPPSFSDAAAIGWLLVASVAVPLALQARALKGRSYAVLSGRTRPVVRRALSRSGKVAAVAFIGGFYVCALGVPAFGAVVSSVLVDFGASLRPTFVNYRQVFLDSGLAAPLERSIIYALITASVTVVLGFIFATQLARKASKATRLLDLLLLSAVALPGVVFGAGYIFAYNLPQLSSIGVNIYQTVMLLVLGYVASSLPTNARVLVGAVSQLQRSLHEAGRAHGLSRFRAWWIGVFPVISRPLMMAWLLTFCGVLLELPISQLLYPPGSPPASVAIQSNLGNYHFGTGMAQAVVAVGVALVVVALVLGAYRLLAPRGWRRIGGVTNG